MAKYITSFDTLADYQAATLDYPNVSVINEDMNVIYTKEAPTPVFDGFCKLTLSDDSIIEIQGSGRLKEEMISQYKSTLVSVDVGALCTSIEGMTRNVAPPYGHQTFGNCPMLSTLKIGSNVRNFSWSENLDNFDDVFTNSPNISSVVVSPRNSIIDSRDNCNAIIITSENKLIYGFKDTIIPNSVTSIGAWAFATCTGLTSVTIPNSITSIGDYAFNSCSGLTSVTIPNSVTSIGNWAFGGCSGLASITVDSNNTVYDSRNNCNAIIETATNKLIQGFNTTVVPSNITSIGSAAFGGCSGLTSVTIPNSVTSIGDWAFGGCSGLTSVTVEATTPPQLGINAFNNTNNCPIYVPSASVNAYKAASGWSNYASRIQAIPFGSNCYEVISTPITSYTPSDYEQVFSFADTKWYMKNNLDNMEEYGIYETGTSLSDFTTYEGKLAAVGTTEYQYSGGSWIEVGTYEDSSVTYEIDGTASERYSGQELSTTFKVPISDVQSAGMNVEMGIGTMDGGRLSIRFGYDNDYRYTTSDMDDFHGTVTDDGEYFYLSLPSEAPQSIVIDMIEYWRPTPIHIIAGSKNVTVEYDEKAIPLGNVYNTVADMEDDACPNIGVGQYGVVGNNVYQFNETSWNTVNSFKLMEKNADEKALVLACNSSTDIVKEETRPSYFDNITDVVIGDCVTSIGSEAFKECRSLTSITIPNSVTSIGDWAFATCTGLTSVTIPNSVTSIGSMAFQECSSLTSVTIPNSVTSIGDGVFQSCRSLTSVIIPNSVTTMGSQCFATCTGLTSVTIPNSVTSIGINAFINSKGLTSVTVEATTPPQLGINAFKNTNNCPIYVPSASVNAYKGATNWSSYASRIQAIP